MGKKYIIELKDNTAWLQWVKVAEDGTVWFDYKYPEDLTPYTEPDIDAIRNEAYEKGVQDTKQHWADAPRSCAYKLGYENGLNDAWEAARKICTNWVLSDSVLSEIFGMDKTIDDIMKENTASEVIEKIRKYEQEKKEQIQVGDEVINDEDVKGVTIDMDDYLLHVLDENGVVQAWPIEDAIKTDRHFPEIVEVLAKMKESE